MSFAGRVALVTGGSRGIGAATARLLAKRNIAVAVNYASNEEAAREVLLDIQAAGGEAMSIQADVRDAHQVNKMVDAVLGRWGKLDILVSNASMAFQMKSIADFTWEEFAQKLNDEVKSAFLLTQQVTPHMAAAQYGRIVYVASGLARRPGPHMAAHGTAKAALVQFAKYVAAEYGPQGIVANIISPGLVQTDATRFQPEENLQRVARMTPLGHVATPEDVAHAIAMYTSEDCCFVTGSYVPVNGGIAMD
jgi:3-oxoacyl-[acyl-carrier protein] reductase